MLCLLCVPTLAAPRNSEVRPPRGLPAVFQRCSRPAKSVLAILSRCPCTINFPREGDAGAAEADGAEGVPKCCVLPANKSVKQPCLPGCWRRTDLCLEAGTVTVQPPWRGYFGLERPRSARIASGRAESLFSGDSRAARVRPGGRPLVPTRESAKLRGQPRPRDQDIGVGEFDARVLPAAVGPRAAGPASASPRPLHRHHPNRRLLVLFLRPARLTRIGQSLRRSVPLTAPILYGSAGTVGAGGQAARPSNPAVGNRIDVGAGQVENPAKGITEGDKSCGPAPRAAARRRSGGCPLTAAEGEVGGYLVVVPCERRDP